MPRISRLIGFVLFFCWISFFPQPVQERYWFYACLAYFFIFLIFYFRGGRLPKAAFTDYTYLWLFLFCLSAGTYNLTYKQEAASVYLNLALSMFFVFSIGKSIASSEKDLAFVSVVICLSSLIVALLGATELFFRKNIIYESFIANPDYERYVVYQARPVSTQFNPVVLGSYLLGCLPFNFHLLKEGRIGLKIIGIISFGFCASMAFFTFSRGVFLGLIAAFGVYIFFIGQKKHATVFLLAVALVIFSCAYLNNRNLSRFGWKNLFAKGDSTGVFSTYRLDRIGMSFKMFSQHPVFGIGFKNFRARFDEFSDPKNKLTDYEYKVADNMYLTILAETGITGFLGFAIFVISVLLGALRSLKKIVAKEKRLFLFSCLAAFIGLLVNMGGYDLFYWANPYTVFCLLLGMLSASFSDGDNLAAKGHFKK